MSLGFYQDLQQEVRAPLLSQVRGRFRIAGPSMEEAQQADKRAWEVISDLCNLHQWTLDNAIYEVTEVGSSALLSPRPVMPKLPPAPHPGFPSRGRGRGNKGKGGKDVAKVPSMRMVSARPFACVTRPKKDAMTQIVNIFMSAPRFEQANCGGARQCQPARSHRLPSRYIVLSNFVNSFAVVLWFFPVSFFIGSKGFGCWQS